MRASADDAEQPLRRLDQLSVSRQALLKPLVPLATFMQAGRPDDVAANAPDIDASVQLATAYLRGVLKHDVQAAAASAHLPSMERSAGWLTG